MVYYNKCKVQGLSLVSLEQYSSLEEALAAANEGTAHMPRPLQPQSYSEVMDADTLIASTAETLGRKSAVATLLLVEQDGASKWVDLEDYSELSDFLQT